jgi:light-regulated signal transduction histidine kinase (bacteriophytochrome)
MLVLDREQHHVIAASENAPDFLDVPLTLIVGATLDTILSLEILGALRGLALCTETVASLTYLGSFHLRQRLYSLVAHWVGVERVVEFERVDRLVSPELTNQVITNFVNNLGKITDETKLCEAITRQVKDLTGFNRILLYRFDEVGHGNVLCEENDGMSRAE